MKLIYTKSAVASFLCALKGLPEVSDSNEYKQKE